MELEGGPLYQWDTGRKVKSDAAEVHFATQPYKTYDVAVKDGAARVPDELLQRAGTLRCWAWTGSRTLEAEAFEVTARNRPSGYAYEPTTQREIADAVRAKEEAQAARGEAQGFAATAKGYASAAAESAAKAEAQATEATERARDCEAAEGRAQDAADAASGYAERAKASADAASASAEAVAQGIGDEAKARADADARLAADLEAETAARKADTQGALEERTRIEREYKAADKAFDNKLTGGLNSITGGLTAVGNGLTAEQKARADADTALGKRIDNAEAQTNALKAGCFAVIEPSGQKLTADELSAFESAWPMVIVKDYGELYYPSQHTQGGYTLFAMEYSPSNTTDGDPMASTPMMRWLTVEFDGTLGMGEQLRFA